MGIDGQRMHVKPEQCRLVRGARKSVFSPGIAQGRPERADDFLPAHKHGGFFFPDTLHHFMGRVLAVGLYDQHAPARGKALRQWPQHPMHLEVHPRAVAV